MGSLFNFGASVGSGSTSGSTSESGTKTTQRSLSQEAVDKLIYDVLSSDSGLAAIATAENVSGGSRSSSKTLMAQDLIAKVVGEIANITAPVIETASSQSTSSAKKSEKKGALGTVICTYLATNGYMNLHLYLRGLYAFTQLNPTVVRGYHAWAEGIVRWLDSGHHPWAIRFFSMVAVSRYEMLVNKKFGFWGAATIYFGEPICWLIGSMLPKERIYAR